MAVGGRYQGKNVHIVGFAGAEGAAVFRYFLDKGYSHHLTVHDSSEKESFLKNFRSAHTYLDNDESRAEVNELMDVEGVTYHFGSEYLNGVEEADVIFVPQSWYLYESNRRLHLLTAKMGSMMKLYFDLFPGKIVGVTGSNGKTTASNMIYHVLERDAGRKGHKVYFAGNDRRNKQILDVIDEASDADILVLEISNRHLKIDFGKSPDVSVITNITPNHLLEYDNFEDYRLGKLSIFRYATDEQAVVMNLDDEESRKEIKRSDLEHWTFGLTEQPSRGAYVKFGKIYLRHSGGEEEVMDVSALQVRGSHNVSNALSAVIACHLMGVSVRDIGESLDEFEGVPQRLELVGEVGVVCGGEVEVLVAGRGVRGMSGESSKFIAEGEVPQPRRLDGRAGRRIGFYNDSASTDPVSTIAGLRSFEGKSVLIVGGKSKGVSCEELVKVIRERCGGVVVIKSPFGDELVGQLRVIGVDVVEVEDLQDAVKEAFAMAVADGDVQQVLFSPSSEYFVYFKDKMKGYKNFRTFVERL